LFRFAESEPLVDTDLNMTFPDGHVLLDKLAPADESRDRYALTHLHAKGGMGQVWLARDKTLGRLIALKELRPDQADNPAVNARFLYEARITAQLEHPGIVPVYEMGQGEAPFYTMRFVRGKTLSAAIRDHHARLVAGKADSVEKIELLTAFVGICRAMAYAHSRGIVHRDLKGHNIALGDFGEVMVLDWGLAKRIGPGQGREGDGREAPVTHHTPAATATAALDCGSTTVASQAGTGHDGDSTIEAPSTILRISSSGTMLTSAEGASQSETAIATSGEQITFASQAGAGPERTIEGELLGTPGYMAPEQAQGRHDCVDERTDVYGLGAILYEILTDRPPFTADKTAEIIRKICQEPPTPPGQVKAGIDPRLQAICLKALAKKPEERYVSAAELALDVQRWLGDLPVGAYRDRWTSHALRWARRHKTLVASIAALLAATSIALAAIITMVTAERIEAETQGQQARRAVQLLTKVAGTGFDDQLDSLQREFLESALAYYNQFTSRVADVAQVRLEHGRAYQQMGDIERKLGRLQESQKSYRRAIEILEPLADSKLAEPRQTLARTRTLLADLLVRGGGDYDEAERLYGQAIPALQDLAIAEAATIDDCLRLGQSLKSQADLLRLNGHFREARPVYDRVIAVLEPGRAGDPWHAEIKNDLAMAIDARGWIHRELGDVKAAEQDYRSALELLDALIADFPTSPRYRESLARMCNSLGLIEQSTGRLNDAELHLRRELPLVERLSQDFPDRPEYKRELARTWMNLGNVLGDLGRPEEAGPALVRAVELNRAIAAASPRDVQIRLDLAKCHTNLGELRRNQGEIQAALKSLADARSISERLVADFPDQPRYRAQLAGTLINIALALEDVDKLKAEQTDQESVAIFEKLVADYPDNIDYRLGLARCLSNFAPMLAASNRVDKARDMYRKALATLEAKKGAGRSPECLRQRGLVLNNFGQLLMSTSDPQAELTLRDALGTYESLVASESSTRDDQQILAITHANLGGLLVDLKRLDEAGPHFDKAVHGFETLIALKPGSIATQSFVGMVLEMQANWFDRSGKPEKAKLALESAINHQRRAVELSHNGATARERLGSHQLELAWIEFKVGADDEAARIAVDLPRTVPASSRPRACFDAARVLARRVGRLGSNTRITDADRAKIARTDIGRLALFLREAIDVDPKLAEPIKTDADIKGIASRPEFLAIIQTVVDLRTHEPK
jgi:eukaryotic-like serine/threonine-protein kinase